MCKLCKEGIEDELHFLFECRTLKEPHVKLFNKCPETLNYSNAIDKFNYLSNKPFILSNYVNELWKMRQEKLLIV